MNDFYIGYVPTSGKKPTMPFSGKTSDELLTLEAAQRFYEYAGVLASDAILVDIDTEEETDILFNIVKALNLKCRVLKSRSGGHFLFKIDKPLPNRTKVKLAIGLTADIKGCGKASVETLKIEGNERVVLYDAGKYEVLPKWLMPIDSKTDIVGMCEGDGRNSALYSYILTLQKNEFSVDECRECLDIINQYVLKEPLPQDELRTIVREKAFTKPMFFTDKGGFLFHKFAQFLVQTENIIKMNGKLYIYRDGVYISGDSSIEAAMIKHIPSLNQSKRSEVMSYLQLLVDKEAKVADANYIAFNNGILDVVTETFHDFDPKFIITNKIPHNYNPFAESELLDKVMMKLACFDSSVLKLLFQATGYTMYRRNELRKSFFLLGEKRNGKSTYLAMLQWLLGEDNVANLDLSEIGSQFKTAELNGRLANIGDDIDDAYVSNTSVFKKVVSGDVITAEKKGKDPFKLRSYAKFFFSANALPRLGRGKDTAAIMDRLVVIPFDAKFTKDDPDYDPFIKYKLQQEDVIEALIAKAIPALREVLAEQEFEVCDKIKSNMDEFEKTNNPILAFFEELEESDYMNEPVKKVYREYNSFCLSNNLQAMSSLEFNKQMKKNFNLSVKNVEINGQKVRCFVYEE